MVAQPYRRLRAASSTRNFQYMVFMLTGLIVLTMFSFSDLLRSPFDGQELRSGSKLGNTAASSTLTTTSGVQLRLITAADEPTMKTSAAHCALSTMNERAWQGGMCSYKSLCFDPTTNEFVFYRAIQEVATPPHGVNLGKGTQFSPRVINGRLPVPRYDAGSDETFVFMEMSPLHSKLEDFLRDDLFAWWLLAQHATWADQKTIIRPLSASISAPGTLSSKMLLWYEALPLAPLATIDELKSFVKKQQPGGGEYPICFPRAVAGLGSMTDHCLEPDHDFHELKKPKMSIAVEAIPCATGRGPLFYKLREEMISRLTGGGMSQPKRTKQEKQVILFAMDPDENKDQLLSAILPGAAKARFPQADVQVVCTSCRVPKEQLDLALTVSVMVTRPAGAQSLAAHFLRRGAGVVLVDDTKKFPNFGLWNNLAYIRARWTSIRDQDVLDAIEVELEKSEQFM